MSLADTRRASLATPSRHVRVRDTAVGEVTSTPAHVVIGISAVGGAFAHILSYSSIQPVLAGIVFFVAGLAGLRLARQGPSERFAFRLMFSMCWLWSGVAAVYLTFFDDPSQGQDALWFYLLATEDAVGAGFNEVRGISEGTGAILLWRSVYDVFNEFGFAKERYIGVGLNSLLIALTAAVGVRTVGVLFSEDRRRMHRYGVICSCCGIFWLFGAIHLRDAAVVFSLTALCWSWVKCLKSLSIHILVGAVLANLIVSAFIGSLRQELLFLPFGMFAAGLVATAIEAMSVRRRRVVMSLLTLAALPAVIYGALYFRGDIVEAFSNSTQYTAQVAAEHEEDSLGVRFVTNTSGLIRVVVGSAYLFIFPIPVWVGFQDLRVYSLFKSLHALFMYAFTPLVALAAWRIVREKALRTAPNMFLLLVSAGLIISVAMTSLETRHFAMALTPMMVLAAVADTSTQRDWRAYKSLLRFGLSTIILVHILWAIVKYA